MIKGVHYANDTVNELTRGSSGFSGVFSWGGAVEERADRSFNRSKTCAITKVDLETRAPYPSPKLKLAMNLRNSKT